MQAAVQEPGRVASGVLAVIVHFVFFGMLVFGISWQKKTIGPVMVDLWEELPPVKVTPQPKPEPKPLPPPKIEPKPEPEPKIEPKPVPPPRVEAPKPSQADIELKEKLRKEREEERQRQAELNRLETEKRRLEEEKKRIEEEQRKREEEARKREEAMQLAEELRKEEQVRRLEQLKREEEARRLAALAEQQRREQELARKQREAEEARQRAESAARAAPQKLINDYVARIQAKIRGKIYALPDIQGNPQAIYEVVLLPGGDVLSATLKQSSGVPAYDMAVERAIMAAQPLPVPSDPNLFQSSFRVLELKFRPKE